MQSVILRQEGLYLNEGVRRKVSSFYVQETSADFQDQHAIAIL